MKMLKSTDLIVVAIFIGLFSRSSADLIYDTCQKTKYSSLCESTLRSNWRMATADAKGLASYMFEVSLNQAFTNIQDISSQSGTTKDPATKKCLSICSELYKGIVDNIHLAVVNLKSNAYEKAVTAGNTATFADMNCEGSFASEPSKPKSPITQQNTAFFQLATIAVNIVRSFY